MSVVDSLLSNRESEEVRLVSFDRREEIENTEWRSDPDYGSPLSLDELRKFAELDGVHIPPNEINPTNELIEIAEQISSEWEDIEPLFGGMVDEHGYIDSMYLPFGHLQTADKLGFERYAVLHFKRLMDSDPSENAGLEPDDSRFTLEDRVSRHPEDDDELWLTPDAFTVEEYPEYGKTIRLWWD